jgi:outer membrane protein TolC
MKKIIVILFVFVSITATAQNKIIKLSECIDAALLNKANIKASKTESIIAGLQNTEAKGKYLPQISISYQYIYNPIIATQVIPTGQFLPVPTNDQRPIKFGTNWQQNAGLNLFQPIIDFTIQSKIAESRINEKIKNADLQIAGNDLKFEVLKSFGKIMVLTEQEKSAVIDTVRTFKSLTLIKNKFDEGKVLKTDLNKSQLNHNNALGSYKASETELVKEKIYMSFLTSIPLVDLLDADFDFSPLLSDNNFTSIDSVNTGSDANFQQLNLKEELLKQQIKTERRKFTPTIGVQAFLGANQFSNNFDPFLANSWYGSSNVGLSLKLPILSGENTSSRIKQLETQTKTIDFNREDLKAKRYTDFWQANEDIKKLKDQIQLDESNVSLMTENVTIYQDRFSAGQLIVNDLNLQELDLQREKTNLLKQKADLINLEIQRLNISGNLDGFIQKLKGN